MTSTATAIQNHTSGIGDRKYFVDDYSGRDWTVYNWLVARVVEYSTPGPVLDLGCGMGYFVEAARRWGLTSVGLDGSKDAVELGVERHPEADIRHHNLGTELPLPGEQFQTVLM
jgi:SAM-dependent methyltransferase